MALDPNSAKLVVQLSLVEPVEAQLFGECAEVSLQVRYDPSELWGEPQVTLQQQNEAVAALAEALESGQPVRFGVMGTGVAPGKARCSFVSRGLRLHEEQPGTFAVYSYL